MGLHLIFATETAVFSEPQLEVGLTRDRVYYIGAIIADLINILVGNVRCIPWNTPKLTRSPFQSADL